MCTIAWKTNTQQCWPAGWAVFYKTITYLGGFGLSVLVSWLKQLRLGLKPSQLVVGCCEEWHYSCCDVLFQLGSHFNHTVVMQLPRCPLFFVYKGVF